MNSFSKITELSGTCIYFENSYKKNLKKITIINNIGYTTAIGIIIVNDKKLNLSKVT